MRHGEHGHSDGERRAGDEHDGGQVGAGGASREGPDPARAVDRRSFLTRTAVAGATAWATPVVLSCPAAAGPGTGLAGDFVSVGYGDNPTPVATFTTDAGMAWSSPHEPFLDGVLRGVAADGPTAVAVGGQNPSTAWALTSFDGGQSWSLPVSPSTGALRGVATDESGRWVAVGSTGTRGFSVASTNSGLSWDPRVELGINQHLECVACGASTWVAGGYVSSAGSATGLLVRSTDGGSSWGAPIVLGAGWVKGVATDGGGTWIAVTAPTDPPPTLGPSQVWVSSDDGNTWTGPVLTVAGDLFDVATTDGTWLVVGQLPNPQQQATVWRSTSDGASWSSPITVTTTRSEAWAVAPGASGSWVVVGSRYVSAFNREGCSWTSTDDGLGWPTSAGVADTRFLQSVAAT